MVAVTPDGARLVTVNGGSGSDATVLTVDIASGRVGTRFVADGYAIATAPDRSTFAVPDTNTGDLLFVDAARLVVTGRTTVGEFPADAVFTPDGRTVLVTAGEELIAVDVATRTVRWRTSLPAGYRIGLTPDGGTAFVSAVDEVAVVDVRQGVVQTAIVGGKGTDGVAVTPDGRLALVADRNRNVLTAIDVGSRTVVAEIPTGDAPTAVWITPDGRRAYTADSGSGTVTVIGVGAP